MKKVCLVMIGAICIPTISGCAINPQTGQLEIQPEIAQNVKNEFNSVFNNQDPCSNNDRNIGIVAGAVAGALLGHTLKDNKTGTLVGAALGAGLGGLIGHSMDTRRCNLYRIAQTNGLNLASANITQQKLDQGVAGKQGTSSIGLDVQIQDQGKDGEEFEPGTAILTPQARNTFIQIAQQYTPQAVAANSGSTATPEMLAQAQKRKILIVGHADETNDPDASANLSDERAKTVAEVFASQGVPAANIYWQGAGDTLPIASNATGQGKAENRRVQIVDVPSDADLRRYLQLRSANPKDFSTGNSNPVPAEAMPQKTTNHASPSQAQSRAAEQSRELPHKRELSRQRELTRRHELPSADKQGRFSYNFGGGPAPSDESINLGTSVSHSMFSFIRNAHAAEPVIIGSCLADKQHLASPVRNLATGKDFSPDDALPGFYGAPWIGMVNGNLIAVLHPYVSKDAGDPVPSPKIEIYRNYVRLHEKNPSFARFVPVNVYRGSNVTVYRMFVGGAMQCMDLVTPVKQAVGNGNIYYPFHGVSYLASSRFNLRQ